MHGHRNLKIYDGVSVSSFKMRNVSCKSYSENQNTFCFKLFFYQKNRAVDEIMWKKNLIEPEKSQTTM